MHQRKQEYKELIGQILSTGKVPDKDHEHLHEARKKLGLSDRKPAEILNLDRDELHKLPIKCPYCGGGL